MDTKIERSWWEKHRWKLIGSGGALVLSFLFFWIAAPDGVTTSWELIRTGEVTHGDFQEIIVASGTVEPEQSVLIDAKEGGTILEIKVEEGKMVEAGEVLISLQNEALILDYMQRETQIVEQINNLRNTRIALEQNLRSLEDQLSDVSVESRRVERQFMSDSALFAMNGIARNEFYASRDNYRHLRRRSDLFNNRLKQDRNYQRLQFGRIDASISLMERNLEKIRTTIEEMTVKAPLSGQLNDFNLEVGQVVQRNQSIGRIDVPGKFRIRALVDQHYLSRVAIGQFATIEFNQRRYKLEINKVQTLVENGQFEVLLSFVDEAPEGIRRGQNFQVHIEVSAQKKALMVPRGSFYESSGGNYVYVISDNRSKGIKREVTLGKQNPEYYEVIDGLEKGEEIIISTYSNFKEEDKISITQNDES